ncbi:Efflux pump dotC [Vanrija pseudolonga]|uniref:Efflux pump dotC n=1 Tax=Vanrija pseudolonga TaxID=143232 RepID=A0AAF0YBF7_9TREE|nr:Efflux pump dotC [Vanrija pseudolonga]
MTRSQSPSERTPLISRPGSPEREYATGFRKTLIVWTTMVSFFLTSLDMTIVATCVPTISSELNSFDREPWIGTAYLWSSVTFTPLYGRLADILGRRVSYLQALLLFTVGTFFCGFAPNFNFLILARFVAGMGGGGVGTVSNVIMAEAFSKADMGFYQGVSFAVFGAGLGLGGPVGGWLTQHFGWRAAFYAQVPISAVLLFIAPLCVEQKEKASYSLEKLKEIDFGGSFTLLVAIGAFLLLLERSAADIPITHDAIAIAAASITVASFVAFIIIELKFARKPILPLSFLRRRVQLCVGIIAGTIAVVNFNMMYHLPMVFEVVFKQSLSEAGAHLIPNSIAMTVVAPLVGMYVKKTKRYQKAMLLFALGPIIAMLLLINLKPGASWAHQWLSVLPMGAGFNGILTLNLIANLNTIDPSEIAIATGYISLWRAVGQVFGVGLSGAVFQNSLGVYLSERFTSEKLLAKLRRSTHEIPLLSEKKQALAREAYQFALRNTFILGLIGAVFVLLTTLAIPDEPLTDPDEKVNEAEAEAWAEEEEV